MNAQSLDQDEVKGQNKPLKVHILYGSAWGFRQRYEELAGLLNKACRKNGKS